MTDVDNTKTQHVTTAQVHQALLSELHMSARIRDGEKALQFAQALREFNASNRSDA